MSNTEAIQTRIKELCNKLGKRLPDLSLYTGNTPLEDIELLCGHLGISVADFFCDDLFRA